MFSNKNHNPTSSESNYSSNMDLPTLPYDPDVDSFGNRILVTDTGQLITYEEAFQNTDYVDEALRIPTADYIPKEFTMFVLRKLAINEKDFRSFQKKLHPKARAYLQRLVPSPDSNLIQVHSCNDRETPSTFRGVLTRIFCRKVMCNLVENLEDDKYDEMVAVFPFKVLGKDDLPKKYDIKILQVLDDDFYNEIQWFLKQHFDNVDVDDAREICLLFLNNIQHFIATEFSAKALLLRNENYVGHQFNDYLNKFPRLNRKGINWFRSMYREFAEIRKCFKIDDLLSYNERNYSDEYFQYLPEHNFTDLYSFLEHTSYFQSFRLLYTHRFKKYLFFFVHSLKVGSNTVFFIDDLFFELSKSLRRYKTVEEDISMITVLAKITLLHRRLRAFSETSYRNYYISKKTLGDMKRYISECVVKKKPRLNIHFKTDLLAWTSFRTEDSYFDIRYTKNPGIKDFFKGLLYSILCPRDDPIQQIVYYNAFLGIEKRFVLPSDVESLKNFIRLCNKCDVTEEIVEKPCFLTKYVKFICTEYEAACGVSDG